MTPQRLFITLFAVTLFSSSPTEAQTQAPAADPCKTQDNTIEINECGKIELAKKDKELNAAYQALIKRLAPSDKSDDTNYTEIKKQLVEAQRNWIKYRDADCSAKYTLYEQGTIRGIVHLSCLKAKTEQRTKELLEWDKL